MNKKYVVLGVVAALIIAGGSFYGGTVYANSKTPARGNFQAGMQSGSARPIGQGGMGTGMRTVGGGFTAGEIISKDATSITVKLPDGGSKIVFFSGSTVVSKSASGTTNDLTVGAQITVTGTTNSDGSVTAQSVQMR
jgi:hypothetical protein